MRGGSHYYLFWVVVWEGVVIITCFGLCGKRKSLLPVLGCVGGGSHYYLFWVVWVGVVLVVLQGGHQYLLKVFSSTPFPLAFLFQEANQK